VRDELWCVIVQCGGGRRWGCLGCGGSRERCYSGVVSGVGGVTELRLGKALGWHQCRWVAPVLCFLERGMTPVTEPMLCFQRFFFFW